MIITIGGYPGSGKSSLSKSLSKKFNLKRYGMGDFRRELALKRGMDIDQLNALGEKESWTDDQVDNFQKELGKTESNFVIDGRLSWYFISNSLKIFLNVDVKRGAERIFEAKRSSEKPYKNVSEVEKEIKNRVESDKKRYKRLYGVNPYDLEHYDLVIDTTDINEEEMSKIAEKVINSL